MSEGLGLPPKLDLRKSAVKQEPASTEPVPSQPVVSAPVQPVAAAPAPAAVPAPAVTAAPAPVTAPAPVAAEAQPKPVIGATPTARLTVSKPFFNKPMTKPAAPGGLAAPSPAPAIPTAIPKTTPVHAFARPAPLAAAGATTVQPAAPRPAAPMPAPVAPSASAPVTPAAAAPAVPTPETVQPAPAAAPSATPAGGEQKPKGMMTSKFGGKPMFGGKTGASLKPGTQIGKLGVGKPGFFGGKTLGVKPGLGKPSAPATAAEAPKETPAPVAEVVPVPVQPVAAAPAPAVAESVPVAEKTPVAAPVVQVAPAPVPIKAEPVVVPAPVEAAPVAPIVPVAPVVSAAPAVIPAAEPVVEKEVKIEAAPAAEIKPAVEEKPVAPVPAAAPVLKPTPILTPTPTAKLTLGVKAEQRPLMPKPVIVTAAAPVTAEEKTEKPVLASTPTVVLKAPTIVSKPVMGADLKPKQPIIVSDKMPAKKETSKISLEAAQPQTGGPKATPGQIMVKTIKVQPLSSPKTVKPEDMPAVPADGSAAAPQQGSPSDMVASKRKTSRISLDSVLASDSQPAAGGPKTIKLKKPSEAVTVKFGKKPAAEEGAQPSAAAAEAMSKTARIDDAAVEESATMSGKRTVKLKKSGGAAGAVKSSKSAQAPDAGMPQEVGEKTSMLTLCFIIPCFITVIITMVTIWMFTAQAVGRDFSGTKFSYKPDGPDLPWSGKLVKGN